MDGQDGYNCAIFRNEGQRQSSEIILEAEEMAFRKWGPNRLFTYIDPKKIRSTNPGYCFKMAGWKRIGLSKSGKVLLAKYDGLENWVHVTITVNGDILEPAQQGQGGR